MAAARPAALPPRAVDDEVVDLLDDDIVEIRDSAPPSGAIAARPATAPPSVQPPHFAEPPPVVEPLALDQFPIEAESHPPSASSDIPAPYEPEASQPPPPDETSISWPSSIPPRAETPEPAFAESEPPIPLHPQRPGFDFDDVEEEPPASSRRAIASSMDEALADAAAREVPLHTPPPESGPQEAVIVPKISAFPLPEPDFDESLPGSAEADQLAVGLPTSAQLGNTVTLEEGGAVEFEVEAPAELGQKESTPPPSQDFEIRLPQREAAGTYDSNLAPPPEAQSELDAHRERAAATEAELAVEAEFFGAEAAAALETTPEAVETFERAPVRTGAVTSVTGAPQRFRPGSFLELLDASLKLGKD